MPAGNKKQKAEPQDDRRSLKKQLAYHRKRAVMRTEFGKELQEFSEKMNNGLQLVMFVERPLQFPTTCAFRRLLPKKYFPDVLAMPRPLMFTAAVFI